MTNPTEFAADEEGIQRLLHDLDVELNVAYADPNRILFPELSPYYARLVDYPLVERLTLSAKAAEKSVQGSNFRRCVSAALHRASEISLGHRRTLLLVDLAYQVAKEAFSDLLWRRLLWRADDARLPIWIGDLAIRLEEWQVNLAMDNEDWKKLIETVEPLGFDCLLRWSFLQARSMPPPERQIYLQQTMSMAVQRLVREAQQFLAVELDPLETQQHLSDILSAQWNFRLSLPQDHSQEWEEQCAKETLQGSIKGTERVRNQYIARGAANDVVDFPSLEMV